MGLIGGLDIGKRAIMAQAERLKVTGQNITNANMPGYSRQRLELKSIVYHKDQGIQTLEARRIHDSFIDRSINNENQSFGNWDVRTSLYAQIEAIIPEPSEDGLNKLLSDFWNSWHDLANNPEGIAQRSAVVQRGITLSQAINNMDRRLLDVQKNAESYINDRIKQINTIAEQIAELNLNILKLEASTEEASMMRDNRDLLIDKLSKIVNINVEEKEKTVAVYLGGTSLVDDGAYKVLDTTRKGDKIDIIWKAGAGNNVQGNSNTRVEINNGELYGLLFIRNEEVPNVRLQLNKLASTLASEVNNLHEIGFGLDGTTGIKFFNDMKLFELPSQTEADLNAENLSQDIRQSFIQNGIYLSETATIIKEDPLSNRWRVIDDGMVYTIRRENNKINVYTTFASKISVNDELSRNLRLVAAADDRDELGMPELPSPGNNGIARAIASLSNKRFVSINSDISSFYSEMVSSIGTKSKHSSIMRESVEMMINELKEQKESISGVSIDEEMSDLIRFQKAYEAAARYISVINEMLGVLMNIGR